MSVKRIACTCLCVFLITSVCIGQSESDSIRTLLSKEQDPVTKLELMNQLSTTYHPTQPDSMILYATQTIGQGSQLNDKSKKLKEVMATARFNLALGYSVKRMMDTTLFLIRQPIQDYKELGDSMKLANAYKMMAVQFFRLGKTKQCVQANDSAIAIYEQLGEDVLKASIIHNKAQALQLSGDYVTAIKYYLESLDIKRTSEADSVSITNTLNNICYAYYMNNDYDQAEIYCLEALEIRRRLYPGSQMVAQSILNMGALYVTKKEYDKAIASFKECIEMTRAYIADKGHKKNGEQTISIAVNNLAEIYNKIGDYNKAEKYIMEAIELTKKVNDPQNLSMTYNTAGTIYMNMKQYDKAIANIKEGVRLAKESEAIDNYASGLKYLSNAYKQKGDYKQSLEYFEQYKSMDDSIYSQAKSAQITEMQTKYESAKKDNEIQLLNSENQLKDFKLAQNEKEKNYLIAGIVVTLILLTFIFYNYRAKQKAYIALDAALQDREILLKEIHHRVKNNLQVISSLLNLQADSLQSNDAKAAVKEGQSRVKSMALIHQNLYAETDLKGVDFKEYLVQLTNELYKTYGIENEKIPCAITTHDIKLDIDTLIPIGLIINELVTNTLKYAFDNGTGQMEICLEEKDQKLYLLVKDNGKGIDQSAFENNNSFGWKMIKSLGRKLKAEIAIANEVGTTVELKISRYKLAHEQA